MADSLHAKGNPSRVWIALLLGLLAFALFFGTKALQHDRDTIYRLLEIESGNIQQLTEPRHMLFGPLGVAFYHLWGAFGYQGRALLPSQILCAFFGGLGIFLMTLLLSRFCKNSIVLASLVVAFAGGYSYWYHSSDVYYWIPTMVCFLAGSLFLLRWLERPDRWGNFVGAILAIFSSILLWSASALLFIPFGLGFLTLPSPLRHSRRWQVAFLWGSSVVVMLVVTYLLVGLFVHQVNSPSEFVTWLTTYPGKLPIWGNADPARIKTSAWSFAAAILPLWNGLGLRDLLRGQFSLSKIIPQLATLVSLLVGVLVLFTMLCRRQSIWARNRAFLPFLLSWILVYSLFITWFDPFEPKWWVTVLIPLWCLLAIILERVQSVLPRHGHVLIALWSCLIVLANFTNSMGPRSSDMGDNYRQAQYTIEQMSDDDVLVSTLREEWTLLVQYFGRHDLLDLHGVAMYAGPETATERLKALVCTHGHGRVFLVDYQQYSPAEWDWETSNTGLRREQFDQFRLEEAWRWNGTIVWEIALPQDFECPAEEKE